MKLAGNILLFVAVVIAVSNTVFAKPYEYGLELVGLLNSPVINNMDFDEAKAKKACFCISDMDGNGWLEFTIAKMDGTGMYLDYVCYEYEVQLSSVHRTPGSGQGSPGWREKTD